MQEEAFCVGCMHSLGEHFQSVDGKVRCLHEDHGVSSRGITGLPWAVKCDCVDYTSPNTAYKLEEERRQKKEEDERWQEFARVLESVVSEKRLEQDAQPP